MDEIDTSLHQAITQGSEVLFPRGSGYAYGDGECFGNGTGDGDASESGENIMYSLSSGTPKKTGVHSG